MEEVTISCGGGGPRTPRCVRGSMLEGLDLDLRSLDFRCKSRLKSTLRRGLQGPGVPARRPHLCIIVQVALKATAGCKYEEDRCMDWSLVKVMGDSDMGRWGRGLRSSKEPIEVGHCHHDLYARMSSDLLKVIWCT